LLTVGAARKASRSPDGSPESTRHRLQNTLPHRSRSVRSNLPVLADREPPRPGVLVAISSEVKAPTARHDADAEAGELVVVPNHGVGGSREALVSSIDFGISHLSGWTARGRHGTTRLNATNPHCDCTSDGLDDLDGFSPLYSTYAVIVGPIVNENSVRAPCTQATCNRSERHASRT